jgi:outer membrane protein OmpA-like peptidoglycan-associated protein
MHLRIRRVVDHRGNSIDCRRPGSAPVAGPKSWHDYRVLGGMESTHELETQPMPLAHVSPRSSSLRRALVQALVLSLVPVGIAFAQSSPLVRVIREGTEIRPAQHAKSDVIMTAPRGTELEVIHIEGDRYAHRDSNWYWVLLPRDPFGTRPAGWIRGDAVEYIPPAAVTPAPVPATGLAEAPRPQQARTEPSAAVASPLPVPAPEAPGPLAPAISEMVLNFNFGKSDLSDEAKGRLADAVALLKASAQGVSFALEGYADWTGPESFNEKLGLARAESVRRHLAEQHQIPIEKISVVSYGENNPAASNATREGRAQNRRVVIKVGT